MNFKDDVSWKIGWWVLVLCFVFCPAAFALEDEPKVVAGEATFEHVDDRTVNITASHNSILEYRSFNIAANERINFSLPSRDAISLNRVTGGSASRIDGALTANGNLIFVNTAGIHFGPTANIEVGGLIASTRDIRNEDFLAGRYLFGSIDQSIEQAYSQLLNEGTIRTQDGGFGILIGSSVENKGLIVAPLGTAALASGDVVTVGISANGKISIGIDEPTSHQVLDFEGRPISDQIKQSGEMSAAGGQVILHARTAKDLFHYAVNQTGIIRAESVVEKNGVIEIIGEGAPVHTSGTLIAPKGTIKVSSTEDLEVEGDYFAKEGQVSFEASRDIRVVSDTYIEGQVTFSAGRDIYVEDYLVAGTDSMTLRADADLDGVGAIYQAAGTIIETRNGGDLIIESAGEGTLADLDVAGDLRLAPRMAPAVYLEALDSRIMTSGSFYIEPQVVVNASNAYYKVGTDWVNMGSFVPGTSLVELYGPEPAFVRGDTDFYNLTSTEPGKMITFESDATQTVEGTLIFRGLIGKLLVLRSTNAGVPWKIDLKGQTDVSFVDMMDSTNVNIHGPPIPVHYAKNSGGNSGWDFSDAGPVWTNASGSGIWSDPSNWSAGFVPGSGDIATFNETSFTSAIIDPSFLGNILGLHLTSDFSSTVSLKRDLSVTGDVLLEGGTLAAGSHTLTVGGHWVSQGGTFDAGASTVNFTDASKPSTILGDNTFYHFTSTTPSKKLYFEAGATQTVLGSFILKGDPGETEGMPIYLRSTDPGGVQWRIDPRGSVSAQYVYLGDSWNISPEFIKASPSNSYGNNTGWNTNTVTWDGGGADNYWATALNWNTNIAPTSNDDVQFTTLSSKNSTWNAPPTWSPSGYATASVKSLTISGYTGTLTIAGYVTINGNYSQSSGIVNFSASWNMEVAGLAPTAGTFTLSGGTFTAPLNGFLAVGGNFTKSGGTFNHNNSAVNLNGGNADFNPGNAVLYNLTHGTTGTKTLKSNVTVLGTFEKSNGSASFTSDIARTIFLAGNYQHNSGTVANTVTIEFNGSSTQTINVPNPGTPALSSQFKINKSAGSVVLGTLYNNNLQIGGVSSLTVTLGTFDANGKAATINGPVTINGGTYLASTATQTFNGGISISSGTFTGSTGAVDVTNFTQTGGTFTAPSTTLFVSGNFSRTLGTFTHNSGTVKLDGTNQTISGSTTFNHLTKTVAAAATLTFTAGTTQTIAGTLTLQGASGQLLSLRSSATPTQWSINPQGARSVSFVNVQDSNNINVTAINASSSVNSGNNINWNFGVTISGQAYTDLGITPVANGAAIQLVKNGLATGSTLTTGGTGSFSFAGVFLSSGEAILVYLDNNVTQGNAVTLAASASANITGLNIYGSSVIGRHESAGPVTNASFSTAKGALADTDILYSVSVGNLTVNSGMGLIVWTGKTFTPGGNVTTQGSAGHVTIQPAGTFSAGSGTITVSGNFTNSGTFTAGTSIVNFNAASGTQPLNSGGSPFATITHSGAGTLQLVTNALTVTTLNNNAGVFDLAGRNVTITTLSNDGTLRAQGGEAVAITTPDTNSGTVLYAGDGVGGLTSFTLHDFSAGGTDFFNLTINASGGETFNSLASKTIAGAFTVTAGTYNANANTTTVTGLATVNGGTYQASTATQTFNAGITISSGTFTGSTGTVDVNGAYTQSGGTVTAPSTTLFVSGNFDHSVGTFTHNGGTVNLDGTNQTISGSTTFNHLTKTVAAAATLTFTAGTTQTVAGTLTLQGVSGQLLSLRSSATPTQWSIDPQGARTIAFLDIKDSNNINVTPINVAGTGSVDSGNNTGWVFMVTVTISGNAYADAGVTALADGATIQLVKNGTATATTTTGGGAGAYSFSSVTLSAGDAILVYIDNHATDGNTVTLAADGASNITGLNIYGGTLTLRHESAGPVTNTSLSTAIGSLTDAEGDLLYSVSAGNLTVNSGIGLRVWSAKTQP